MDSPTRFKGVPAVEPPPTAWTFPPYDVWPDDDDLVAIGADLAPGTLLDAYRRGLFPMPFEGAGAPGWWSPLERGVLELGDLRVTRSLRRSLKRFEVRVDTALPEVVAACADPRRPGGWIDDEVRAAYVALARLGWVHSVEAWRDGELVGGLYGVAIGGLFAGESMFHRERDASKAALVGLVELLRDEHADARLLDTQWVTDHLATLGVREVPRDAYLERLRHALALPLPAVWR